MHSVRVTIASALATVLVVGTTSALYAMVCPDPPLERERWTLSLTDLSVDDQSVDDLSDYDELSFSIETREFTSPTVFTVTHDVPEGAVQELYFHPVSDESAPPEEGE